MPYIAREERERAKFEPRTPGELNYAITCAIIEAWQRQGHPLALNVMAESMVELCQQYWDNKIQNYTTINDVLGAIAGAIMEFRRRSGGQNFGPAAMIRVLIARKISEVVDQFYLIIAAPYEDEKLKENGDVYPT